MSLSELSLILATVIELLRQDDEEQLSIVNQLIDDSIGQNMFLTNGRCETSFFGIVNYGERTVWRYSDVYFHKHFRMSKTIFEVF